MVAPAPFIAVSLYRYFTHGFIRCEKPFHDLFLTNVNQSESRNDFFTRAKPVASNQHEAVFTYQRIRSGPAKFSETIFQAAGYFFWLKVSFKFKFYVYKDLQCYETKRYFFEREIYKQEARQLY